MFKNRCLTFQFKDRGCMKSAKTQMLEWHASPNVSSLEIFGNVSHILFKSSFCVFYLLKVFLGCVSVPYIIGGDLCFKNYISLYIRFSAILLETMDQAKKYDPEQISPWATIRYYTHGWKGD